MNGGTLQTSEERTIASMGLTLAAAKSLQAEYLQRAMQAEQMVATLMSAQPENIQRELTQMFIQHLQQRSTDRSIHQNAVLQATVIAVAAVIRVLLIQPNPHPVNTDGKDDSEATPNPVNTVGKAVQMLQHIQAEIDRCLNVDEEARRIAREAQNQSVNT